MPSRRKRLLFVTDSLGLPRVTPTRVEGEFVWVNHVAREMEDACRCFFYTVGGLHTNRLVESLATICEAFEPEILVLQVGIVDCAAKALSENERKIVARLPAIVQRPIHRFIRDNYARIVRFRDITYVPKNVFRANLLRLKDTFSSCAFVVVPIGAPNRAYSRKNPLIARNIAGYNAELAEVFGEAFLSETFTGEDLETLYIEDHHHLSKAGHRLVTRHVSERIRTLVANGVHFEQRARLGGATPGNLAGDGSGDDVND
ncbi:MAG: hypothetical protein ACRENE_20615 [Polyangiaceae bacterium]